MLVPRPPDTIRSRPPSTNVSVGEARAILRRHESRPQERHPHLTAMGMPGKRQRHPIGHCGEDVRLVHHQDHRIVARNPGHGRRQIVGTAKTALPQRKRELIAEAGQPEARARLRRAESPHSPSPECRRASAQGGSRLHETTSRDCPESRARRAAHSAAPIRRPRPAPEPARSRIGGWRRNRQAAARCRGAARSTVSTILRMRSIPILGPPACRSAMHRDVSLCPAGQPRGVSL